MDGPLDATCYEMEYHPNAAVDLQHDPCSSRIDATHDRSSFFHARFYLREADQSVAGETYLFHRIVGGHIVLEDQDCDGVPDDADARIFVCVTGSGWVDSQPRLPGDPGFYQSFCVPFIP